MLKIPFHSPPQKKKKRDQSKQKQKRTTPTPREIERRPPSKGEDALCTNVRFSERMDNRKEKNAEGTHHPNARRNTTIQRRELHAANFFLRKKEVVPIRRNGEQHPLKR